MHVFRSDQAHILFRSTLTEIGISPGVVHRATRVQGIISFLHGWELEHEARRPVPYPYACFFQNLSYALFHRLRLELWEIKSTLYFDSVTAGPHHHVASFDGSTWGT